MNERIESSNESKYTEDFEQSHPAPSQHTDRSKFSTPGKKQFSNHVHTDPDAEVVDDSQSYSQNFDHSQSMPGSSKNQRLLWSIQNLNQGKTTKKKISQLSLLRMMMGFRVFLSQER